MQESHEVREGEVVAPGTSLAEQHMASLPAEVRATLKSNAATIAGRISAGTSDMIRLVKRKDGMKFVLPNGQEGTGPLRLVVLDFVTYHAYYDRGFVPGSEERTPPACFALSKYPDDIAPSHKAPAPQSDACKTCWANEFKSHPTSGKGKACGQHRLLAVVEPSADANAPLMLIKVPPKSNKHWDKYVSNLLLTRAGAELGTIGFTTEVWFNPDSEYQELRFGNPEPNANIAVHVQRLEVASKRLMVEPDVSGYTPPPEKKGKK